MNHNSAKLQIERAIRSVAKTADDLVRSIGSYAERPFLEHRSAQALADFLQRQGFKVDFPFKQIPTAFRAERGRGKPSIGILGEYDALPDCGRAPGTWGHGCGHNLLGVASAVGAIAAAAVLEQNKQPGKIVYYGCPAEEVLAGKAYMARDGAFRELDACLAWHPGTQTNATYHGGAALDSILYAFHGRTAHAARPQGGKSALDGAVLFDVAVNYLRESIPENVRIHAVIVDGGDAPNVVPAYARSWYYIRGRDRAEVDEVRKQVEDCARGAAIATQTTYTSTRIAAIYSRLPNDALFELVTQQLAFFGSTSVTAADKQRARQLGFTGTFQGRRPLTGRGEPGRASSDEDTVSRLTPLGHFRMATQAVGTPSHHRLLAEQSVLPFALRGMKQAGKVLAGTAVELISHPHWLARVRNEFKRRTRDTRFDPLIPKRQKLPAIWVGE